MRRVHDYIHQVYHYTYLRCTDSMMAFFKKIKKPQLRSWSFTHRKNCRIPIGFQTRRQEKPDCPTLIDPSPRVQYKESLRYCRIVRLRSPTVTHLIITRCVVRPCRLLLFSSTYLLNSQTATHSPVHRSARSSKERPRKTVW